MPPQPFIGDQADAFIETAEDRRIREIRFGVGIEMESFFDEQLLEMGRMPRSENLVIAVTWQSAESQILAIPDHRTTSTSLQKLAHGMRRENILAPPSLRSGIFHPSRPKPGLLGTPASLV